MADVPQEPDRRALRVQAVAEAVRQCRLDRSYALAVAEMIDEDDDGWPACCGSSCDPCVLTLATAARRARDILRAAQDPATEPLSIEPTATEAPEEP